MGWWLTGAAVVGGLLWVFKGGVILLGYGQPEHAFEVAPLLFALVTLGLARQAPLRGAGRVGVAALAVVAVLCCLVAAVSSVVTGDVLGPDLLAGMVTMTAALVVAGLSLRRTDPRLGGLVLLLGTAMIPVMAVGGALSLVDERLLEVAVVAIGLAWMAVAGALLPFDRRSESAV